MAQPQTVSDLTATKEGRKRMEREFTLRMLGQYVTFTGWRWLELLAEFQADSELGERIERMLHTDYPFACPRCGDPGFVNRNTGERICGNSRCEHGEPLS